ncbi:MAG TPA: type II toxin-antitoxin system VapC family toxin [archaeon]|nr:type II toxin-antitoxin system VapC family toxin [archaeon]
MVCLDTDILVGMTRKDKDAVAALEKLVKNNSPISTTPISLTELYVGAYKSGNEAKMRKVEEIEENVLMLEYDFNAAKEAGRITNELNKTGSKIGEFDTLIGAIVLRHGETLITRNTKHFSKIRGLKVEKW